MLPIFLLIGGGIATIVAVVLSSDDGPVPDYQPDLPPMPGSTGYRLVDTILPDLKKASASSGIPLGVLVGWIAKESGGRLGEVTKLDERGYFQLMPDESKSLGLDHARLSTDSAYSIAAGVALITSYMKKADAYGIFPKGSSDYWRLVKLIHTVGNGDVKKYVDGATAAGQSGYWNAFETYALSGAAKTKHSPAKWFPLVDKVADVGRPFGFGQERTTTSVGADNASMKEGLARAIESSCPRGSIAEKQAVGWVCRNRAAQLGIPIAELLAPKGTYGARGEEERYFVSTFCAPGQDSLNIAQLVLILPDEADPTGGAIDFWNPKQQLLLQHVALAQGAVAPPGEEEVRKAFAACGLKICGVVGDLELLCG